MEHPLVKLLDELDAAFFTGDCLVDPTTRKEVMEYLSRWKRQVKSMEETFPNGEEE